MLVWRGASATRIPSIRESGLRAPAFLTESREAAKHYAWLTGLGELIRAQAMTEAPRKSLPGGPEAAGAGDPLDGLRRGHALGQHRGERQADNDRLADQLAGADALAAGLAVEQIGEIVGQGDGAAAHVRSSGHGLFSVGTADYG